MDPPIACDIFGREMELDSADCLRQVMAIQGVLGVSLIDYASGLTIGSAGREPSDDQRVTASGVTDVMTAALRATAFTETGAAGRIHDLVLTTANGYHLVFLVGGRPDAVLGIYVWLDRVHGNLAMAQRRIRTLTTELTPV
jgi:hypothetical protein